MSAFGSLLRRLAGPHHSIAPDIADPRLGIRLVPGVEGPAAGQPLARGMREYLEYRHFCRANGLPLVWPLRRVAPHLRQTSMLRLDFDFRPMLSPFTSRLGDAVHKGEELPGDMPIGCHGDVGSWPLGCWGELLRLQQAGLRRVEHMRHQSHRLVKLDAQVREHLSDEHLLHRQPPAQIGELFVIGHRLLHWSIARIKAVFAGRAE